jgi:hypothetical protein
MRVRVCVARRWEVRETGKLCQGISRLDLEHWFQKMISGIYIPYMNCRENVCLINLNVLKLWPYIPLYDCYYL